MSIPPIVRYSVVLCDFDYTLGDSTKGIVKFVNIGLGALGHPPTDIGTIAPLVGLSLDRTYVALTGDHDVGNARRFIEVFVGEAEKESPQDVHLYEGTLPFLRSMRGHGAQIGIVTTKKSCRIHRIFGHYGGIDLIDLVIGSDSVTRMKPDPEGINRAMEFFNVSPDDVVYIGDCDIDAEAAHRAGVDFIGVRTGITSSDEFVTFPSLTVLDDISGVMDYLLRP